MKRFTSEGTNVQEGQELIPAQSNGEEAPLGLSFEGLAGARRYSRRQAIGLLGGSLAGLSLLSLGLAAPAESADFNLPFKSYDHITLEWESTLVPFQSTQPNKFLDGRTQNGIVGLAPHTNPPFTGTRWEIARGEARGDPPDLIYFKCLGNLPGPRMLTGYPFRGSQGTVGLSENESLWRVRILPK